MISCDFPPSLRCITVFLYSERSDFFALVPVFVSWER